ncbi:hypothetical protein CFC21_017423, partial [Triticum aestivum]
GRASRRSRHPPRRRSVRPLAGRPPRQAIQLCLLPLLVLPGSPPRQPPRRVLSALPEGQVGGEGAIGEVHGGGVGRGTAEGRARGHQGAAQHNPLPPHPDAGPSAPADHLRLVFYRMGLDDKEIVALSGAHTLGRSRPERSGWGKPETKYTKNGPGAPGGQSWTAEWLKFDNSYFKIKEKGDQDLLVLPTDAALFEDPTFKVYAEKYAADEEAFFKDYAEAHAKLSSLGAKFDPAEGFSLDD